MQVLVHSKVNPAVRKWQQVSTFFYLMLQTRPKNHAYEHNVTDYRRISNTKSFVSLKGKLIDNSKIKFVRYMQYHKAAFLGQERAKKAQMKLFDYAGFAMLTYTIKQSDKGFEPVGEEMLAGKIARGDEAMLFICDKDGYAKAQSKPLPMQKSEEIYRKMITDGIQEFMGMIKTVS